MKKKVGARRGRGGSASSPLSRTPFSESYREVVELAPIGIYTSTLEGRFLAANDAFARMLGYESVEEVLRIDIPRDCTSTWTTANASSRCTSREAESCGSRPP